MGLLGETYNGIPRESGLFYPVPASTLTGRLKPDRPSPIASSMVAVLFYVSRGEGFN